MSNQDYLECSIDLKEKHLNLGENCIGAAIPFAFGTNNYEIHLPKFDLKNKDGFNHPRPTRTGTKIALSWIEDQKGFGSEHTRDKDGKVLGFSVRKLIIKSVDEMTETAASAAKKDLKEWQKCFTSWLEAYHFLDLEDSGFKVVQDTIVDAYLVGTKDKKPKRIASATEGANIYVTRYKNLKLAEMQPSLLKTTAGNYPPSYYSLLISGLRNINKDEYRVSLLDTATAVEMALTELLDRQLTNLTTAQKQIFAEKHLGIHNLRDALKKLGVVTHNDLQQLVGSPRNKAIHKGEVVSKDAAQKALDTAKKFLYDDLPL
jgi:hypothetical protein